MLLNQMLKRYLHYRMIYQTVESRIHNNLTILSYKIKLQFGAEKKVNSLLEEWRASQMLWKRSHNAGRDSISEWIGLIIIDWTNQTVRPNGPKSFAAAFSLEALIFIFFSNAPSHQKLSWPQRLKKETVGSGVFQDGLVLWHFVMICLGLCSGPGPQLLSWDDLVSSSQNLTGSVPSVPSGRVVRIINMFQRPAHLFLQTWHRANCDLTLNPPDGTWTSRYWSPSGPQRSSDGGEGFNFMKKRNNGGNCKRSKIPSPFPAKAPPTFDLSPTHLNYYYSDLNVAMSAKVSPTQ